MWLCLSSTGTVHFLIFFFPTWFEENVLHISLEALSVKYTFILQKASDVAQGVSLSFI